MKKIKSTKEITKRNKNIKKFIILCTCIFTTITVKAGINDSTLSSSKQYNKYSVIKDKDGKYVLPAYIHRINNDIVYSIELNKNITTNTYSSTYDLSISNYTKEQIEYVKKLIYFGYTYPNGTNNAYSYLVTQQLIWEYLYNVDIYWSGEDSINGYRISMGTYINNIYSKMNEFDIKPSFDNEKITMLLGENLILSDENNILDKFYIKSSSNIDSTISDSNLIIKPTKPGINSIILSRKNAYPSDLDDTILYYSETSPNMLSVGMIDMPLSKVTIETKGLTLNVNLIDSETKQSIHQNKSSLTGAIYELYDINNNKITEFTSIEGEYSKIDNLSKGKYYLIEKETCKGYKSNEDIIEINMNELEENISIEKEIMPLIENPINNNKASNNEKVNIEINSNKINSIDKILNKELFSKETSKINDSIKKPEEKIELNTQKDTQNKEICVSKKIENKTIKSNNNIKNSRIIIILFLFIIIILYLYYKIIKRSKRI